MGMKTKIVVLHMKEVIYTVIFIILAIVLILLLVFMFGSGKKEDRVSKNAVYRPGVYTSSIQMDGRTLDVQVKVDEDHINDVSFVDLDETVQTMYPLLQMSMDSIREQILEEQNPDTVSYTVENQYTAEILSNAVKEALHKAEAGNEDDE